MTPTQKATNMPVTTLGEFRQSTEELANSTNLLPDWSTPPDDDNAPGVKIDDFDVVGSKTYIAVRVSLVACFEDGAVDY